MGDGPATKVDARKILSCTKKSHDFRACRNVFADTHGQIAIDANNKPLRTKRWGFTGNPPSFALIALTPKINIGVYRGKTSKESSIPLLRAPNINAAPMAPIKLRLGVPTASAAINIPKPSKGRFIRIPRIGAAIMIGKPVVSQWAVTLAATAISKLMG